MGNPGPAGVPGPPGPLLFAPVCFHKYDHVVHVANGRACMVHLSTLITIKDQSVL